MENQRAKIQTFKRGEVVFQQRDTEKLLYKVLSGEVGIYSDYGDSNQLCLYRMQKDQCFGEMSILEDCPRSATAVAMEDVSLMVYPEQLMGSLLNQNPRFAMELMQTLSERLRNSNNEMEKMHSMLLRMVQQKIPDKEIQDYISKHTIYTKEGDALFSIKGEAEIIP